MWDSGWLSGTSLLPLPPSPLPAPSVYCTEMLQYTTAFPLWGIGGRQICSLFPLLEKKHNCWQIVKSYCEANWTSDGPQLLMETGNVQRDFHLRAHTAAVFFLFVFFLNTLDNKSNWRQTGKLRNTETLKSFDHMFFSPRRGTAINCMNKTWAKQLNQGIRMRLIHCSRSYS